METSKNPDIALTDSAYPVPLGISLAYVIVVEYRGIYCRVACNVQTVCNDGERITLLP